MSESLSPSVPRNPVSRFFRGRRVRMSPTVELLRSLQQIHHAVAASQGAHFVRDGSTREGEQGSLQARMTSRSSSRAAGVTRPAASGPGALRQPTDSSAATSGRRRRSGPPRVA